jgi:hypothetical protein
MQTMMATAAEVKSSDPWASAMAAVDRGLEKAGFTASYSRDAYSRDGYDCEINGIVCRVIPELGSLDRDTPVTPAAKPTARKPLLPTVDVPYRCVEGQHEYGDSKVPSLKGIYGQIVKFIDNGGELTLKADGETSEYPGEATLVSLVIDLCGKQGRDYAAGYAKYGVEAAIAAKLILRASAPAIEPPAFLWSDYDVNPIRAYELAESHLRELACYEAGVHPDAMPEADDTLEPEVDDQVIAAMFAGYDDSPVTNDNSLIHAA